VSLDDIRKLNRVSDNKPSLLVVEVPSSKSILNRILTLASLAKGKSTIHKFYSRRHAEDVYIMRDAMSALNINLTSQNDDLQITGANPHKPSLPIQVGSAGTVLRFLLPLAALHCTNPTEFSGSKRLFERPLKPLLDALNSLGAVWQPKPNGGLLIPPKIVPKIIDLEIDPSLSSQFISGMAMAISGLTNGGTLRWTKPSVSQNYLLLTNLCMRRFKRETRLNKNFLEIPSGSLEPISLHISGDWSAAAVFFCAAAILEREIEIFPLDHQDGQPDAAILSILESVGSNWRFDGDRCHFQGRLNSGIKADLINCPDLAPVLAATAALSPGISELSGLNTLPHKESNRLRGATELVKWLGGKAEELPDFTLRIHPKNSAKPPVSDEPFDPMDDHRMVFAAALGTLRNGGAISNPNCVSKSFPNFWEAWDSFHIKLQ
jgi:3-phosphoshikimate 1-carboxyvinyltransferase